MKKLLIIGCLLLVFGFINLAALSAAMAAPVAPPAPLPTIPGCADPKAIRTAVGCINVETPTSFVDSILGLAIGIAGGIAILLIIYGAFLVLTSSGNPEKVQAGKELITSAITGLLIIIFAVFLLRLIGKDVLEIFQ